MHSIYVISDGTGKTAERAVNAAMTQFNDARLTTTVCGGIRTDEQLTDVMREAGRMNAIVVHTLVSETLRNRLLDLGKLYSIETIDLMGPLLANLSQHLQDAPTEEPGLFHELNKAYFQRVEAMEFALRHDDGQRADELDRAEIVILGVSRTFKTPVSIYLAFRGWMVGNVPIMLDMPIPPILENLPPERVFAFTTRPKRLALLRSVRDRHLGGAVGRYAQLGYVEDEIRYANHLFYKHPGWSIIEVTNKPIEEIGSEILGVIRNHQTAAYKSESQK